MKTVGEGRNDEASGGREASRCECGEAGPGARGGGARGNVGRCDVQLMTIKLRPVMLRRSTSSPLTLPPRPHAVYVLVSKDATEIKQLWAKPWPREIDRRRRRGRVTWSVRLPPKTPLPPHPLMHASRTPTDSRLRERWSQTLSPSRCEASPGASSPAPDWPCQSAP